jgi:mRNA interferase RelE/StbE
VTWVILWTAPAAKDLQRLDAENARRVKTGIERLATTGHGDIRRLQGRQAEWRLRVGDWRVLLRLDHAARTLHVLRVRHRSDAYRH